MSTSGRAAASMCRLSTTVSPVSDAAKPRAAFAVGGAIRSVSRWTYSDCGRIGKPSVVQELQVVEIPLPDVTSGFGYDIASNALVEGTRFRAAPVDHDRAACVA